MTDPAGPPPVPGERRAPAEGWRGAVPLLRTPLAPLVVGQVLGQAGDVLAQVAFATLVLFEVGRGATPGEISLVLAVGLLPFALIGPVAGVLIDRWDRRRLLVWCSVLRAGVTLPGLAAIAVQSELGAFLCGLVLVSVSRFVLAAKGAALPLTVAGDRLVTANAVSSLAGVVGATVAALLGAALAEWLGSGASLVAGSVAYLMALVPFLRLPPVGGGDRAIRVLSGVRRALREIAAGFRCAMAVPSVRRALLTVWGQRILLGVCVVLVVLVADSVWEFRISGYAMVALVVGVGAGVGTIAAPSLRHRFGEPAMRIAAIGVMGAAALAGAVLGPGVAVLLGGLAVSAAGFQVGKLLTDADVQHGTADEVRGRVFVVYDIGYNTAFVLAGLLLVPLWGIVEVRWLLAGVAVAAAGGAAVSAVRTPPR